MTYEWPEGVAGGSKVPGAVAGSRAIAELAVGVRPRYHLAAGGEVFWEREPYRNGMREGEGRGDVRVTRFLGVADWGNLGGKKALYAFGLNVKEVGTVPGNATGCPFKFGGVKRGREETGGGSFFWGDQTEERRGRGKGKRQKGPPPGRKLL